MAKIGKPNSFKLPVDNSDEAGRKYQIAAEALVQDGVVTEITGGSISATDGTPVCHGSFERRPGTFHIDLNSLMADSDVADPVAAITDFIADVREGAAEAVAQEGGAE